MPGGTPYVTPAMLLARPAGIAWNVVPTLTASTAEQEAQLGQECWAATSAVDRYTRQPMRASINTEQVTGPGQPRLSVARLTGVATVITRRWPVQQVAAVQYSPAPPYGAFPPQWSLVTSGQWNIRNPPVQSAGPAPVTGPSGGNVIDLAPGFVDWSYGKSGWTVMPSYLAGWAHTSLTASAAEGDDSVQVDDVTGWAGATGFLYDSTLTEPAQVTTVAATDPVALPGIGGTVQAGPGTLTLSGPLTNAHAAGTVFSALPADFLRAVALQIAVQALENIDAIATQSMSGQFAGGTGVLAEAVELILDDYRRVI